MILWWPLWLKAIQISRWVPEKDYVIYHPNITLEISSELLQKGLRETEDRCSICPNGADVTFPVLARVRDYEYTKGVHSAAYVQLLASWDFEKWFTVSKPGKLTGLPEGNSRLDICEAPDPCEAESPIHSSEEQLGTKTVFAL